MGVDLNNLIIGPCYMPDGTPVPELLSEEEAIRFLRLDEDGPKTPQQTLLYYRQRGLLRGTRIGKRLRYLRKELLKFLDIMTDLTSKNAA